MDSENPIGDEIEADNVIQEEVQQNIVGEIIQIQIDGDIQNEQNIQEFPLDFNRDVPMLMNDQSNANLDDQHVELIDQILNQPDFIIPREDLLLPDEPIQNHERNQEGDIIDIIDDLDFDIQQPPPNNQPLQQIPFQFRRENPLAADQNQDGLLPNVVGLDPANPFDPPPVANLQGQPNLIPNQRPINLQPNGNAIIVNAEPVQIGFVNLFGPNQGEQIIIPIRDQGQLPNPQVRMNQNRPPNPGDQFNLIGPRIAEHQRRIARNIAQQQEPILQKYFSKFFDLRILCFQSVIVFLWFLMELLRATRKLKYLKQIIQIHNSEQVSTVQHNSVYYQYFDAKTDGQSNKQFYLVEQYFNSDIVSWQLFISFCLWLLITHICTYKWCLNYFLNWNPINETNASDQVKKREQEMMLINTILNDNYHYFYILAWYWFIDSSSVFSTSFEVIIYFSTFLNLSCILAVQKIIDKFIATVIDPQISFTSNTVLKKDKMFILRVHKLIVFQKVLNLISFSAFICTSYPFINFEGDKIPWIHIVFLTFPSFQNFFEMQIQQSSLYAKFRDSKAMPNETGQQVPQTRQSIYYLYSNLFSQQQIVNEVVDNQANNSHVQRTEDIDENKIHDIYFEFLMNMCLNLDSILHYTQLIFIKGFNISVFTHFLIGKTVFSSFHKLYADIAKFMQFRSFMKNLEKDFPMIKYTDQTDDCAICQDQMITARKLQCGHVFHQFCIIQLIQSGSKNCPMCRQEIKMTNEEPLAPNANLGTNILWSPIQRLIDWFPRIRFTMRYFNPRQEVIRVNLPRNLNDQNLPHVPGRPNLNIQPAAPIPPVNNQASIERVREVFPQMSQSEIERELRRSGGNVEIAIIQISSRMGD